jgi:hypothetical protein
MLKETSAGGPVPLSEKERQELKRLTKVRRSGISSIRNRRDKLSRNAPCPCGSGKKLKRCHAADPRAGHAPAQHELSPGQRDAVPVPRHFGPSPIRPILAGLIALEAPASDALAATSSAAIAAEATLPAPAFDAPNPGKMPDVHQF